MIISFTQKCRESLCLLNKKYIYWQNVLNLTGIQVNILVQKILHLTSGLALHQGAVTFLATHDSLVNQLYIL